ncbi:PA14 domain-containing protein [Nocardia sp. CC227C]|uniref:PA14 domain-containing protein n=1 Tax=Nocardia sp. CC227C TaxID=3044562 RepID=UPI00278C6386|nr:PA14 domain-containing protein [Nocardia sp. CC227C]
MTLGVSLAQVVSSPAAQAKPSKPQPVPVLDPSKGPKSPQPEPEPAQPVADFTPLAGLKVPPSGLQDGFDPKTSKETARTEKSVTYTNANGSQSVVLSQVPISVRDERGQWVPMDTRIVDPKAAQTAPAARDGANTEFAPYADDPELVKVDTGGAPVSIALEGASKTQRQVSNSSVRYPEALPGQDLIYTVEPGAVKEAVIIKNRESVKDGRWVFSLRLGDGLTPKVVGDSVIVTDARGNQVAAMPPIQVWDSADKKDKDTPAAQTGGKYALARKGEEWLLAVMVDTKWLTDDERVFPITVDPTYTYGFGNTAETRAFSSGGAPACVNTCGIQVGNARTGDQNVFWRTAFRFDFAPLFGKNIIGARMDFKRTGSTGTAAPATSTLYRATSPLGYEATGPELASGTLGDAGMMFSSELTSYIADRINEQDNNAWFLLSGGESDEASFKSLQASLIVDYGTPPPPTTPVAPADESVLATATPTLKVNPVTNPSGEKTLYCFKVSTGFDGRSGTVVDSGCLKDPSWTVPKNVLRDGGRYTWTVLTALEGGVTTTTPQWVGRFSIDQRMGDTQVSAVDEVGPLSVNLFNGNLRTNSGGPQFTSVGGESGVTLAYNSRAGEAHGLRASYFNDSSHTGTADDTPVLVRTEPQVNLDWGNFFSSNNDNLPWKPNPIPTGLNKDWFVIRWEGYFKAPVTGDFRFAGVHSEGAKIWLDNKLVYDNPNSSGLASDFHSTSAKRPDEVTLKAGQRVPLKVELYHRTASVRPVMVLWAKSTDSSGWFGWRKHNWAPQVVKTERLYSADPAPLPAGWTLGVAGSAYSKAEMLDGAVVLTDATGAKHTWAKTSTGGYAPPPGEDGVLAVDALGKITVTEGDVVSVFHSDGNLATVASVLDSKKPAALQYLYSGNPPRLTQIKDPVSGRSHTLHYNTDNSNSCYGGASKPQGKVYVYDSHDPGDPNDVNTWPAGVYMDIIADAPEQMLCRVSYWDGTETRLWYSLAGTLDRVENPGGHVRDYTYENEATVASVVGRYGMYSPQGQQIIERLGPMNQLRDSLAADWLAYKGSAQATNPEAYAIIYNSYRDSFAPDNPPSLRPSQIAQPTPITSTGAKPARNHHIYGYAGVGQNQAFVSYPGLLWHKMKTVTFDPAGRTVKSTDADGVTTTMEWNVKDKPVAVTDGTGRRVTNIYDHADRLTDTFGPAPASCFNGLIPTSECTGTMPHSHVGYDEGTLGLQAALYDNPYLSGVPEVWQTGVGTSDGTLVRNWGATPPVTNDNGWSGRFTGEVRLPDAGEYQLGFTVVDGVRLWVDDVLIVDSWNDKPATAVAGTYTNKAAGTWHRVRIDYYNRSGDTGALKFAWTPPGATGAVVIPGEHLAPRYGYETSKVGFSSSGGEVERAPATVITTGYSDPANGIDPVYGLVVSKTHDPGGENLVRRNSFEQPGDGYLRKLAQALPAGDITNPDERGTFTYYGGTDTRKNPCESNSAAVSQAGMVKTVTSAPNADGSPNVLERVYDGAGRTVATRINNEAWACVSYDARGRMVKKSFPAQGDQPARTITYDYAVDGNPLIKRVSDESGSTTTGIDLLGRVVSYTDATGVATTVKYDTEGRTTSETTTIKGVTSTLNYQWTRASRLTRLDLDGTTVATPTYNAGLLQTVGYGNQSNLTIGYNGAAMITGVAWKTPDSTVTNTVTRSRDQRITDAVITDTANPETRYDFSYTYDRVGRLTAAEVPHHRLTYGYSPDNGCGPNRKAGANTNRTVLTDSRNGGIPTSTVYCYDHADRLISTAGATTLSFEYDTYGNAIKVGTDTLGYDSTRRHITTTTAAGQSVKYTRDVTDRIAARTVTNGNDPEQITRYGFTSNAGGPDFVLDASGTLRQRILKLPGGGVLTKNYTGAKATNWSYPDVHNNILFTADGTGARTSEIRLYDPFGQNIDPDTGEFADIPLPATAEGGMDFGYLGQHTVPIEHIASQQALEMGARTYLPILGRFLQTDPISGGSANNYDYCNADPINYRDLTGEVPIAILVVPALPALAEGLAWGTGMLAGAYAIDKANEALNEPAPSKETPAVASPREQGQSIGAEAAELPKGSGQGAHIAREVTKLGLGQQAAAQAAEAAAQEAFGEASTAKLKNGNMVVLPTQTQVGAWLEVSPDGEVSPHKGSIGVGPEHDLDLSQLDY